MRRESKRSSSILQRLTKESFIKYSTFCRRGKTIIFFPKKFISHHPRTMTWDVWIKLCAVIFCVTQFDEKFVRLAQVIAEIHLYFNNTIDIEWALKYRAERLFYAILAAGYFFFKLSKQVLHLNFNFFFNVWVMVCYIVW